MPKLEIFAEEITLRQQVAQRYSQLFFATESTETTEKNISNLSVPSVDSVAKKITLPFIEEHNTSVYAQYTIQVDNRDQVQAKLNEAGIPTAVHYPIPLNKQPAVADPNVQLPVGDAIAEKVMSLPMHPYMTEEDQLKVLTNLLA